MKTQRRKLLIFVLAIAIATSAVWGFAQTGTAGPTPETAPTPSPPEWADSPVISKSTRGPAMTEEELEELIQREGRRFKDHGPTTLGSTIHIDGQDVKLFDDAWVVARIESTTCGPKYYCGRDPLWILARGEHQVTIDSDGYLSTDSRTAVDSPEFEFLHTAINVKDPVPRSKANE